MERQHNSRQRTAAHQPAGTFHCYLQKTPATKDAVFATSIEKVLQKNTRKRDESLYKYDTLLFTDPGIGQITALYMMYCSHLAW
jgi:hypothetical protein